MKELDAVLAAYEKEDEQAAAMRAEKEQEHEQEATRRAEEVAAAAVEAAALAAARYEERRVRWIERARRGEECLLEGDVVPCTSAAGEPAMDVAWICPCGACDGEAHVKEWVMPRVMKEGQEYYDTPPCGTKVRLRCWERQTEEGAGGAEGILRCGWEARVVQEEKREVQPFGCASTSC